jgi:hypothetical protein
MMTRLIERKPKRVFTFGCSFTRFDWPTWANIVAHDLQAEFYNYGREGAGNLYISNHVMQADGAFGFNQDDLIMICWSGVNREDRWCKHGWITPGNAFHNMVLFGEQWIKEYAHPLGFAIRDYALLKGTVELLLARGCQFHMFSMSGLEPISDWYVFNTTPEQADRVRGLYRPYLDMALPSMYDTLWNGDAMPRVLENQRTIHSHCSDGHPRVEEHLSYLEMVFDHEFSPDTKDLVARANDKAVEILREIYVESGGDSSKTDWARIKSSIKSAGLWLGEDFERPIILLP